ncbi:hypothetical protein JW851_02580, partial [Candidatus Woesearchaeota archaeon]|nr:hypothetical protein [Candidatus Woesearchaeota archaeon]
MKKRGIYFIVVILLVIFLIQMISALLIDKTDTKLLNMTFNSSGELMLSLEGAPVQITLTGEHIGNVSIEIDEEEFYTGIGNESFSYTKNISLAENITIGVELENSTLFLDRLDYSYSQEVEEPVPYWNSNTTKFVIFANEMLEID